MKIVLVLCTLLTGLSLQSLGQPAPSSVWDLGDVEPEYFHVLSVDSEYLDSLEFGTQTFAPLGSKVIPTNEGIVAAFTLMDEEDTKGFYLMLMDEDSGNVIWSQTHTTFNDSLAKREIVRDLQVHDGQIYLLTYRKEEAQDFIPFGILDNESTIVHRVVSLSTGEILSEVARASTSDFTVNYSGAILTNSRSDAYYDKSNNIVVTQNSIGGLAVSILDTDSLQLLQTDTLTYDFSSMALLSMSRHYSITHTEPDEILFSRLTLELDDQLSLISYDPTSGDTMQTNLALDTLYTEPVMLHKNGMISVTAKLDTFDDGDGLRFGYNEYYLFSLTGDRLAKVSEGIGGQVRPPEQFFHGYFPAYGPEYVAYFTLGTAGDFITDDARLEVWGVTAEGEHELFAEIPYVDTEQSVRVHGLTELDNDLLLHIRSSRITGADGDGRPVFDDSATAQAIIRIPKDELRKTVLSTAVEVEKVDLKVYPNPTTDYLELSVDGIVDRVVIVDAVGKRHSASYAGHRLSVHHLPAGRYYLVIQTTDGKQGVRPFIKVE